MESAHFSDDWEAIEGAEERPALGRNRRARERRGADQGEVGGFFVGSVLLLFRLKVSLR